LYDKIQRENEALSKERVTPTKRHPNPFMLMWDAIGRAAFEQRAIAKRH